LVNWLLLVVIALVLRVLVYMNSLMILVLKPLLLVIVNISVFRILRCN